jgi:hypothetical protein
MEKEVKVDNHEALLWITRCTCFSVTVDTGKLDVMRASRYRPVPSYLRAHIKGGAS